MAKKPLTTNDALRIIKRLFDHYGVDRSPGRDRANDVWIYLEVILRAVCDGLLKAPDKKGASNRGAPSKWKGQLGIELLRAVQNEQFMHKSSIAKALEQVQSQDPQKWGSYILSDLEKRYYEAKKFLD